MVPQQGSAEGPNDKCDLAWFLISPGHSVFLPRDPEGDIALSLSVFVIERLSEPSRCAIKSLLFPTRPCPAHPYKVSESEKSQLVNETRWQYYGTSDTSGDLSLTWNTSLLPVQTVTIELWGYEETGRACQGLVEVLRTSDTQIGGNESQEGKEAGVWEAVCKWKGRRGFQASVVNEEGFADRGK